MSLSTIERKITAMRKAARKGEPAPHDPREVQEELAAVIAEMEAAPETERGLPWAARMIRVVNVGHRLLRLVLGVPDGE